MMIFGMCVLMYLVRVGVEVEGEEIGKGVMVVIIVFLVIFVIGFFFILLVLVSRLIEGLLGLEVLSNLVEGVIWMILFIVYIYLIGCMSEIRWVFMYYGVEYMIVYV